MTKRKTEAQRFAEVEQGIQGVLPQVFAWCQDSDAFRRLSVKPQEDGTYLAVAAGYGPDGTPMVCFGVGYGPIGCLYGLEGSLAAGAWKPDKFA